MRNEPAIQEMSPRNTGNRLADCIIHTFYLRERTKMPKLADPDRNPYPLMRKLPDSPDKKPNQSISIKPKESFNPYQQEHEMAFLFVRVENCWMIQRGIDYFRIMNGLDRSLSTGFIMSQGKIMHSPTDPVMITAIQTVVNFLQTECGLNK